jgi:signal transduction histidine kinase
MGDVRVRLSGTLERTRRLMFDLHPQLLEMRGVSAALTTVIDQLSSDIGVHVKSELTEDRFDEATESLVYRTFVEALSNVGRHSQAREVSLVMSASATAIHGSVVDDGIGFDMDTVKQSHLHLGLEAMSERVRLAGGKLAVKSRPGNGTEVSFEIPRSGPLGGD